MPYDQEEDKCEKSDVLEIYKKQKSSELAQSSVKSSNDPDARNYDGRTSFNSMRDALGLKRVKRVNASKETITIDQAI